MPNLNNYIPEGTRDILFNECYSKIQIENLLRDVYKNYGYHEIISPTLEFYDVFNMNDQPISQEKMFKLFDNRGRILVLRADMTTPIARIAATKIKKEMFPMKLCYSQNIFRVNEILNGKLSEFTQSGIEILGSHEIRGDVEAIYTGIEALKKIGLEDFKIEIGDSKFFKELTETVNLDESKKENLRMLIQNKNISALKEFLDDNKENIDKNISIVLEKLPELFGGKEVIIETQKLLNNADNMTSLKCIKDVYEVMDKLGLSKYISVDLGMLQNLNYYSGLIFRGYCMEVGDSILSGGRYDKLIENFGDSLPATGFAINVDIVLEALRLQEKLTPDKAIEKVVFCDIVNLNKGYALLKTINRAGVKAEVALFDSEEEALEYCERVDCYCLINVIDKTEHKMGINGWSKKEYKF
ncbi:ATP phosphoribosyltransferase regulatory subunit [Clostridium akagii]|uniref:ATP phosphoribosyltransferase regulatory subunit n=1 Tax=Clostridium akagii TaxID=91623 RepID=UPI000561CCB0|nr:ATP phosphoribosyltransferase regulatory subunit [Clostridium akagii]